MNFLDLLKPPDISSMSHPFTREAGQTGEGKPALQSLARNLFGLTHSPEHADWANEHVLQDPTPEQYAAQQEQQRIGAIPASLQYNDNQDPLQKMVQQMMMMKGQQ